MTTFSPVSMPTKPNAEKFTLMAIKYSVHRVRASPRCRKKAAHQPVWRINGIILLIVLPPRPHESRAPIWSYRNPRKDHVLARRGSTGDPPRQVSEARARWIVKVQALIIRACSYGIIGWLSLRCQVKSAPLRKGPAHGIIALLGRSCYRSVRTF